MPVTHIFSTLLWCSIVEQVNVSWVKTFGLLTANQGKLLG